MSLKLETLATHARLVCIVHPPPYRTDRTALERDTRVEIYTGGGPGGQHRNKTQNAVRLHHQPSGLIISATERRSQAQNLSAAFERLIARLEKLNEVPEKRYATRPTFGSKKRRLGNKTQHGEKKKLRRRPIDD